MEFFVFSRSRASSGHVRIPFSNWFGHQWGFMTQVRVIKVSHDSSCFTGLASQHVQWADL